MRAPPVIESTSVTSPATLGNRLSTIAAGLCLGASTAILAGPHAAELPGLVGLLLENLGHFPVLGALAATTSLLFRRTRPLVGAALILVALNAALIARHAFAPADAEPNVPPGTRQLSLLYANLGWPSEAEAFTRLLGDPPPDILLLAEYDPEADLVFALRRDSYPHAIRDVRAHPDCFGMAILARVPGDSELVFPDPIRPVPALRFSPDGAACDFWLVHTIPPRSVSQREARNRYLAGIARMARERGRSAVLVGDLNTTERSTSFDALLEAGFRDTRDGRGRSATWRPFLGPLSFLNALVTIPLDHILVYGAAELANRAEGPDFGSDHLPLAATIVAPPA